MFKKLTKPRPTTDGDWYLVNYSGREANGHSRRYAGEHHHHTQEQLEKQKYWVYRIKEYSYLTRCCHPQHNSAGEVWALCNRHWFLTQCLDKPPHLQGITVTHHINSNLEISVIICHQTLNSFPNLELSNTYLRLKYKVWQESK